MSMTTRFRAKAREENAEVVKLPGKQIQPAKQAFGDVKDKRKAFGDIVNRLGSNAAAQDDGKQKATTAVYKDVKPRVDTRWKKAEVPARTSKPLYTATMEIQKQLPLPIQRQTSKPKLLTAAESITNQIKKTTKLASWMDTKKTSIEIPLIKSPESKLKREKAEHIQKNFYESHSTKLLHQVEDIDEKDADNPQMLAEYVNDIYAYLFKLEKTFAIRDNFLADQMDVTPKMRSVLLDWLNEVHNQFSLEIETYHMTVSMIDRYLQANTTTPRRYLQLVGVTTLFMASKYEELMPPEISDFVYVTDDTYSKEQILQMEKKIFSALGFNLAKPLPIHFMRRFTKAAGDLREHHYGASKYFMELASIDYELTKFSPSQIAAASLCLSLLVFNKIKSDNDLWTPTLEYYSTYSSDALSPVMRRLAAVVISAKDSKLKSVFTKYSHSNYKFISTVPEMNGLKMQEVMNRL